MLSYFKKYTYGFFHLFFPKICAACNGVLLKDENVICTICETMLPKTNFHKIKENSVKEIFEGRVKIETANSFLFFEKGSKTQALLQLLKYHDREDVGRKLGELFAKQLKSENIMLEDIDLIIPLPLHPLKLKKRGYNQCTSIVEAFSNEFNVKIDNESIARIHNNVTQTGKGRLSRWENVENVFSIKSPKNLIGKHILLIDDVITTGATLEACITNIKKIPKTKVSIATLAVAV